MSQALPRFRVTRPGERPESGITMKSALVTGASALALLLAASATHAAEDTSTVEELVVYGKGESRQVQALTLEEIERAAPGSSPIKMVEKLPGVNFQSADAFGAYEWSTRISIRAFNQNQLGFTLDGVPLGDMSYGNHNGLHISRAIATEDLSGVELAQGAGALATLGGGDEATIRALQQACQVVAMVGDLLLAGNDLGAVVTAIACRGQRCAGSARTCSGPFSTTASVCRSPRLAGSTRWSPAPPWRSAACRRSSPPHCCAAIEIPGLNLRNSSGYAEADVCTALIQNGCDSMRPPAVPCGVHRVKQSSGRYR